MSMGEKQKIQNFRDLEAWREAHELVLLVYKMTKQFPADERFGLTNQMRRATISATSNIAEGFGRNTAKDKAQFYSIAKGSILELQSQSTAAKDLGYINQENFTIFEKQALKTIKLTAGLIRSVINR